MQDVDAESGNTFIERYTKGVAAVDTILFLDRIRQNVAVKEALRSTGKPAIQTIRKTMSVPNFAHAMKPSLSSDSLAMTPQSPGTFGNAGVGVVGVTAGGGSGLTRMKASMSVQDFSSASAPRFSSSRRPPTRRELETVPEGEAGGGGGVDGCEGVGGSTTCNGEVDNLARPTFLNLGSTINNR